MPEIRITGEQSERLGDLQDRIERRLVGKYGHVRPQDAIEYLLDRYEADDLSDEVLAAGIDAGGDADSTAGAAADVDDAAAAGADAEGDDADADDGATAGGATDDAGDGAEAAGGAAMLDSMMNLLDANAEKWGEAESSDERYEVELPDGTTESARTKDDVRALLFKHYR
ncbi:MAG: hypothetical protein ABEJ28_10375 [Salinigranum sp.]